MNTTTTVTAGQAVYEAHQAFMIRRFPGIAPIGWDELPEDVRADWEVIGQAGITAGGWDALAAEIEALQPGEGITIASTLLAQVARAVVARLTGTRPQGDVKVNIDRDDEDGARVTIGWGSMRDTDTRDELRELAAELLNDAPASPALDGRIERAQALGVKGWDGDPIGASLSDAIEERDL